MPNAAAKSSSDYLPADQMHVALLALPSVLLKLVGEHKVLAMYGCGTNIHCSLQWTPMDDATWRLQYLIEDSINQRIVVPGESDFIFEVPEKRLVVTFCHESDIHLDGSDDDLLQQFMDSDPYLQVHWYTKDEVANM